MTKEWFDGGGNMSSEELAAAAAGRGGRVGYSPGSIMSHFWLPINSRSALVVATHV